MRYTIHSGLGCNAKLHQPFHEPVLPLHRRPAALASYRRCAPCAESCAALFHLGAFGHKSNSSAAIVPYISQEAIDDYYRYQSDKQANERQYYAVRQGEKRIIQSQDLRVGGAAITPDAYSSHYVDIIWLKENEEIPCDVLVLATPDPAGTCYIQTTNLDGESDLKLRQALPATAALASERLHRFRVRNYGLDL